MGSRGQGYIYQVTTHHGGIKKVVADFTKLEPAILKYEELLISNKENKPLFPIRTIKNEKRNTYLRVLRRWKDCDAPTNILKCDGYNQEFKDPKGKYETIKISQYDMEETFSVFGQGGGFTAWDVVDRLKSPVTYKNSKHVVMRYFNKLVITDQTHYTLVMLKDISDCKRLYNILEKHAKDYRKCIFLGDMDGSARDNWKDRIIENTGITYAKLLYIKSKY